MGTHALYSQFFCKSKLYFLKINNKLQHKLHKRNNLLTRCHFFCFGSGTPQKRWWQFLCFGIDMWNQLRYTVTCGHSREELFTQAEVKPICHQRAIYDSLLPQKLIHAVFCSHLNLICM